MYALNNEQQRPGTLKIQLDVLTKEIYFLEVLTSAKCLCFICVSAALLNDSSLSKQLEEPPVTKMNNTGNVRIT